MEVIYTIYSSSSKIAADAGADWIVTSTLSEDAKDLTDLSEKVGKICSVLG